MDFVGGGGDWHGGLPPEFEQHMRGLERMGRSRLVRVLAIGQEIDAADVRVELIALEVRDAGAILYWKAYTTVDRNLGDIRASIEDDLGTEYLTFPGGGGGGDRGWEGRLMVFPPPPVGARISIHVSGFTGFPRRIRSRGRWRDPSRATGTSKSSLARRTDDGRIMIGTGPSTDGRRWS